MNRLKRLFLTLFAAAAMVAGAPSIPTSAETRQPPVTRPGAVVTPYILHLPGIGGPLGIDRAFSAGLEMARLPGVEIYDWTAGNPGLNALGAYERNRREARVVAGKIAEQYRKEPGRPIVVTGHSGGTGIAVWALEELPADVRVGTVVLMASALSPGYDLSVAMGRVTGRVYAFSSPHDNIVLGTGTTTFGTIDRVYTRAAGMVGFVRPEKAKHPGEYAKLVEMPYVTEWMALGNPGDHIGPMRRAFASQVLSPLLGGTPPVWVSPATRPVKKNGPASMPGRNPIEARPINGAS
jgi:pimeloyl-ACP methyl ester carboxylesterase